MNLFVADPHWGWWIIAYFFLGGIAAGAYFLSTLIELVGRQEDREIARVGYLFAFPLIVICGVLLIVDLNQPARFWHMLLKSEVVALALADGWPTSAAGWRTMAGAPLLKYWSPMSVGSWAVSLFGICSAFSFVSAVRPQGLVARLHALGFIGFPLRAVGCAVGFFVASYTGALLTATNQPVWSDSVWLAPLFLTSAASTGTAALVLFGFGRAAPATLDRMGRADVWILLSELVVFLVFLASLGAALLPVLDTVAGRVLVAGTLFLGLLIPLAIHGTLRFTDRPAATVAAIFVLVGGLTMRWAILATPQELVGSNSGKNAPSKLFVDFGPEAGRQRGQQAGFDQGNRPGDLQPRSKVFEP